MINTVKYTNKWMVALIAGIALAAASCKKEVKGPDLPPFPTKWDFIAGTYKVYDTTGVYLYEMKLTHKIGYNQWGLEQDSLVFENFDGEFSFTVKQENYSDIPMYVAIGSHDTLYDSESKRWKIHSGAVDHYNQLINDTIPLRFSKTNINYYLSDLTPYYACDCKQIAVKQH